MKMGIAQKQNISVQHRIWNMNEKPQVMTCEEWRNHRFQQMIEAGARIGVNKEHDMFKIAWPEQAPIIVSQAEIEADWKRCYLKKGVKA
jgi:hypothetical protein